jgi:adiponectin receptor
MVYIMSKGVKRILLLPRRSSTSDPSDIEQDRDELEALDLYQMDSTSYNIISHNETLNIGTHVFGTIIFAKDVIRILASYTAPLSRSLTARLLYHSTTALCFFCSTLYHTFSNSESGHHWRHVDHLGIQVSIWATACSFVAVAFRRSRARQLTYWASITAGLLAFTTCLWTMWYREIGTQRSRTAMHVAFGAISTLPAIRYWHSSDRDVNILQGFFSLVAINSIGGLVFEADFLAPLARQLDLPDLSHTFMHVMAIYGARIYGKSLNAAQD